MTTHPDNEIQPYYWADATHPTPPGFEATMSPWILWVWGDETVITLD